MLATLAELTEDSLAAMRVQAGTVTDGVLTLTLVQPNGDPNVVVPVGTIDVDLTSGEITGEVDDVAVDVVDTMKLALVPGDVVHEPTFGLLIVQGVSADGSRLTGVTGATVSTANVRRVGFVDLETLDLE